MNQRQDLGDYMEAKYKSGPNLENRKCTDFVCLIIFGVFLFLSLIISIFALSSGNPHYLAQPFDPDHKPCGYGDLEDYPYIYFVSPTKEALYRTVCVSECPTTNNNSNQGTLKCKVNSVVTSCKSNLSPGNADKRILYYDSAPYTGNICLPTVSQYFDKVKLALNANKVSQSFGDLRNTWMIICFSGFFAIGLGYLILKLIERRPRFLIWGLIIIFIVGLFLMSLFFLFKYISLTESQNVDLKDVYSTSNQVQDQIARQDTPPGEYLFMFFLFLFLGIIIGSIIICMKDRINLSVTVISCAAKVVEETKETIFIPIIFYVITFIYFMFWVVVATNLYSCGTVSEKPKSLPFGQFQFSTEIRQFAYIHFFSLIWNSAFLIGACQFITIGVGAYWYYQRNQNHTVQYVKSSFLLFLKYHIGTVAFGSILVALLDALRVILEFIYNQVEQHQHSQNRILQSIITCLRKVLQIFENFLQFINKNSYVMTVMTGHNFKESTKMVHLLVERQKLRQKNNNRIVFSPGFGEVFEVIGNLTIMMVSTIFCYLIISHTEYYTSRLHSPVAPTFCFFVLSYCVGSYFMSLLGTAADGLIVLYFMDEDMHSFQDNENQGQFYYEAQFEPDELKIFENEQENVHKAKQARLQQQRQ